MDIRVLRYFLALAGEGNVSAAAQIMHTTQPNLSRQLAELERELGKKLFIRGSRKTTLTEEGVFLRKRAQEIVSLFDKTEADFKSPDDLEGGEIAIGVGDTAAMRPIARAVRNMRTDYPAVRYMLVSGSLFDITESLDKGTIDFGVISEPADVSKYEYMRIPAADRWGVLMRSDDPLAEKDFIMPSDIEGVPLICPERMSVDGAFAAWLGESAAAINIVMTFNLTASPAVMVGEGVGLALVSQSADTYVGGSLCFRPLEPRFETGGYFVWKKCRELTRTAEKFLEYTRAEINGGCMK